MRTIAILLGAALSLTPVATVAGAQAGRWPTYGNVRFAYQICYPAALLRPQREADNSDGRAFLGARGARLRVWGRNRIDEDETMASDMAQSTASLSEHGGQITYQATKPGWYVLSARQGATLFYQRTIAANGMFKTYLLEYPASDAATWDPIAGRLNACFKNLAPAF